MGKAGSHDPANGRSGGRGDPLTVASHLAASVKGINRCQTTRASGSTVSAIA